MEKAKKRWEKNFDKKMTREEEVMFNWGYVYGIGDILEKLDASEHGG